MSMSEDKQASKNVQLTQELMSNTLVNEVTRVMLSAPTRKPKNPAAPRGWG
jgi:hypothetical protein